MKGKEPVGRQQEVFRFIRLNPGVHLREIQRRLSVSSMGNLEYHIHTLEKLDLIVERTEGGCKRYYPAHGRVKNKKLLALLRQKVPRRIALLILEKMRSAGCLVIGEPDGDDSAPPDQAHTEEAQPDAAKDAAQGSKSVSDPVSCGVTPLELMGELDISPSALSYHLSKMRKQGVLRKEKQGKNVYYLVMDPQEVLRIIVSYRESFTDGLVNSFMAARGL